MVSKENIIQLPEQFNSFIQRQQELRNELFGNHVNIDTLNKLLDEGTSGERKLYNYYYSLLSLGTLYLRLGAVILLNYYMQHYLEGNHDNVLNKKMLTSLRNKLPGDGDWKDIWQECARVCKDQKGLIGALSDNLHVDLAQKFVSNRNNVVDAHSIPRSVFNLLKNKGEDHLDYLLKYIVELEKVADGLLVYTGFNLSAEEDSFMLSSKNNKIYLKHFITSSDNYKEKIKIDIPYIFNGIASWEKKTKYLGTAFGDIHSSEDLLEVDFSAVAEKVSSLLFDFSDLLEGYRACFVGRKKESDALHSFCTNRTKQNITMVYAPAGMGKSALTGDLIDRLNKDKHSILYHFCGTGERNYPLNIIGAILHQKKKQGIWKDVSPELQKKINSLPPKWDMLKDIFHDTLQAWSDQMKEKQQPKYKEAVILAICDESEQEKAIEAGAEMSGCNDYIKMIKEGWNEFDVIIASKNKERELSTLGKFLGAKTPSSKKGTIVDEVVDTIQSIRAGKFTDVSPQFLTIIIDGIDESAVAHSNPSLTDMFYKKQEGEEYDEVWLVPEYVKIIVTYRKQTINNRDYHPGINHVEKIDCVQPLLALDELALEDAVKMLKSKYKVEISESVKKGIIKYGSVV